MTYIMRSLVALMLDGLALLGDTLGGSIISLLTIDIGEQGSVFGMVFNSFIPMSAVLQWLAMGILVLMAMWAFAKTMFTPEGSGETPMQIIVGTFIAGLLVFMGPTLIRIFESLFNAVYKALLTMRLEGAEIIWETNFNEILGLSATSLAPEAEAAIAENPGITSVVATGDLPITVLLASVVLSLLLVYEFVMFILEAIERYVVLGVLFYTSPLAFALAGTKSTRNVFASWCRMFGSQMFLMITNVLFFRLFLMAEQSYSSVIVALRDTPGTPNTSTVTILYFFLLYAILHVGTKMDTYLGTIGLNTAQTGRGLGQSIVMSAAGMGRVLRTAGSVGSRVANSKVGARAKDAVREGASAAAYDISKKHGGESLSFRPGSAGKVATAQSMSDLFQAKLNKNAESALNGTVGGNSFKSVLKEQQDKNGISDDMINSIDPYSFRAGRVNVPMSKGYGACTFTMRDGDGGELHMRVDPIDKNGITRDGMDTSKMVGRRLNVGGQDVFMYSTDKIGSSMSAPDASEANMYMKFAADNPGMKQFMDAQNQLPNVQMENIAPGLYLRTEKGSDGSIKSQQSYADTNIYAPSSQSHLSQQIGDRSYAVNDTTNIANGMDSPNSVAESAQQFAQFQSPSFASNLQQSVMSEFPEIPKNARDFRSIENGDIVSYRSGDSWACYVPTAKYSLDDTIVREAGGAVSTVSAASNGAEYYKIQGQSITQEQYTHIQSHLGIQTIQTSVNGHPNPQAYARLKQFTPVQAEGYQPIVNQRKNQFFAQAQQKTDKSKSARKKG